MTVRVADASHGRGLSRNSRNAAASNGLLRFIVPIAQAARRSSSPGATSRWMRELAERIERISGEGSVDLSVQEPPKLALVG